MKAEIAKKLSYVENLQNPKASLEQYMTPPELAADILHTASIQGDIEGRKVVDLGTGTGILGIGAAFLGGEVVAVEKDEKALKKARENAQKLGVENLIEFVESDVRDLDAEFDTCVMNPPFSVHSDEGMKFLQKAFEIAETVYSVVYGERKEGIKEFVTRSSHELRDWQDYSIELPPTHGFHTEESHEASVGVIMTERD